MCLGSKQHRSNEKIEVLYLKKTLYGLCQSHCAFWKYLTKKLGICGLPQAPFDPCLFIGEKIISNCYIDDLFICSRNEKDIFLNAQLHFEQVDMEQEDDAARFLVVHIEHNPKTEFPNVTQKV